MWVFQSETLRPVSHQASQHRPHRLRVLMRVVGYGVRLVVLYE